MTAAEAAWSGSAVTSTSVPPSDDSDPQPGRRAHSKRHLCSQGHRAAHCPPGYCPQGTYYTLASPGCLCVSILQPFPPTPTGAPAWEAPLAASQPQGCVCTRTAHTPNPIQTKQDPRVCSPHLHHGSSRSLGPQRGATCPFRRGTKASLLSPHGHSVSCCSPAPCCSSGLPVLSAGGQAGETGRRSRPACLCLP